jgi:glutamine cyclotransferase
VIFLPLLLALLPTTQSYKVVHTYPHDRNAFTEGLLYHQGFLYESTGLEGHSAIRKVKLETGEVVQERTLPDLFGEGIVILGGKLYELTWKSKLGFIYDLTTFKLLSRFTYESEGWALTTDGKRLIMSDGTYILRFRDPVTFAETGQLEVRDRGSRVENLNELEYVEGEIYANVWGTEKLVRISPKDGHVLGWIDLSGLLTPADRRPNTDVLNGIAYDATKKRLFVTGKYWPKLFEIKIVSKAR